MKKIIEFNYTIVVDSDEVEERADELLDALDDLCACGRGEQCNLIGGATRTFDYDEWVRDSERDYEEKPLRRKRKEDKPE